MEEVCPQEATGTSSDAMITGSSENQRDLQGQVAAIGFNVATAPTTQDSCSEQGLGGMGDLDGVFGAFGVVTVPRTLMACPCGILSRQLWLIRIG